MMKMNMHYNCIESLLLLISGQTNKETTGKLTEWIREQRQADLVNNSVPNPALNKATTQEFSKHTLWFLLEKLLEGNGDFPKTTTAFVTAFKPVLIVLFNTGLKAVSDDKYI